MDHQFPIYPPADEEEFRAALRALIERADENGVDPENGWGFRTDDEGWSVEILRLAPREHRSGDSPEDG